MASGKVLTDRGGAIAALAKCRPAKGPFLAKPFDPWDLTRLLDRMLEREGDAGERQLGAAAS